ncbi:MAG: hypothetical protein H8E78_07090 [Proteobacteria bacterium]|nr:hypothetical protein [Pseudomonadota bacterium]
MGPSKMRVLGVENWDGLRLDRWQLGALPSSVMGPWTIPLLMAIVTLAGCLTPAPYFLVESRLVQNQRRISEPDVTETVAYRLSKGRIRVLGLQPPDVCADLGQSASGGSGQLQRGILRTRCGVEMDQFERALSRAGYEVVSWGAVQHMSRTFIDGTRVHLDREEESSWHRFLRRSSMVSCQDISSGETKCVSRS